MGRPAEQWRIGILASRVGVSETVLRAWEKRYGLLVPIRTTGGYRLYGPQDERRARAMVDARNRGVPAGLAAAEILSSARSGAPDPRRRAAATATDDAECREALAELHAAMTAYDVSAMHRTIDQLLARVSVETAVRDVLLPFLHGVGAGWERGEVDVADEHFASDLVRTRLAALTLAAGSTTGPLVVLACPPDERHDIALKSFELVLLRAGWRTCFLGSDLPLSSLAFAAGMVEPDAVVVAATDPRTFALEGDDPPDFCRRFETHLAGAGATPELAASWGASHLPGDPVTAAQRLVADRRDTGRRAEAPEPGQQLAE